MPRAWGVSRAMIDPTENERTDGPGDRGKPFSVGELLSIGREIARDFPVVGAETHLRLFDVDPWKAHAFWSISPDDAVRADTAGEGRSLVLRFVDQTLPAPGSTVRPAFDIAVEGLSNNWYVDLWSAGGSYVAELGVRTADGEFSPLARSNRVDMPPAGPSRSLDFRRSDASVSDAAIPAAPAVGVPPDTDLFRSLFPKREDPREFPDVSISDLNPVSVEPTIPGLFPAPEGDADAPITFIESEPAPVAVAPTRACVAATPNGDDRPFPSVASETVLRFSREAGRAEDHAVSAVAAPLPQAVSPPSAAVPAVPVEGRSHGGGNIVSPAKALPIESVAALSSFVNGVGVDFEINAELVIFGRARPGSALSLYGRPVTVADDGTFSVRRPLPQGALVLPLLLSAGNADGGGGEA